MKKISITVPMDYQALTQAAGMFRGLAETMAPSEATAERPATEEPEVSTVETLKEEAEVNIPSAPIPTPEPEAAEVFAPAPTANPEPVATVTTGVDLDVNGLPWDNRIHASTKTKLVTGAWKNKRGVDAEVLTKVEAELRGAMSAPETVLQETPTPAPAAPVVEVPPAPSPEPAATGAIDTFPALMTAITANNIAPEVVAGAVQAVGLQSLPLLAARTDLIPAVAERLGL